MDRNTQLMPFDKVKLHKSFRDAVYSIYEPKATAKQEEWHEREWKK
jgi:hypothetical protein